MASPAITDRALRYRAQKNAPDSERICCYCGAEKNIEVEHIDGFEEHTEPDNLTWACRSCNTAKGIAMRNAGMGRRTRQRNPAVKGATTLGEWVQAVGAITPHKGAQYSGSLYGLASEMPVSEAVAIIRATSPAKRSEFASKLRKKRRNSTNPTWDGRPITAKERERRYAEEEADQAAAEKHAAWVREQEAKRTGRRNASPRNPDYHDSLDVQREGDKAARAMMARLGSGSSAAVRGIRREDVVKQYRIAVEYEGLMSGLEADWVKGWRKGYGMRNSAGNEVKKSGRAALKQIDRVTGAVGSAIGGVAELPRKWAGSLVDERNPQSLEKVQQRISALVDEINLKGDTLGRSRRLRELKEERDRLEGIEDIRPAFGRSGNPAYFEIREKQGDKWLFTGHRLAKDAKEAVRMARFSPHYRKGAVLRAQRVKHNPDDPNESVQDRSYREWQENYEKVQRSPETASERDLRRALGYLDHARERLVRRHWDTGKKVDPNVLQSFDTDHEYFISLIQRHERARGRNPRNPADEAARGYEAFHGKPAEGETIIEEEIHVHKDLWPLGILVDFHVATITGLDAHIATSDLEDEAGDYDETAARAGTVFLAANEEGTQLFFRGGDQSLDLDRLKFKGDWVKDDMIIGVIYEITYRTRKKFDKFKLTDYYHGLGEDTGDQPFLRYDPLSPHLYITGGKYKIKLPLVGVSPGIEN